MRQETTPLAPRQVPLSLALWIALLALPFSFLGSRYLLKFGENFFPEAIIAPWILVSLVAWPDFRREVSAPFRSTNFLAAFTLVCAILSLGLLHPDADFVSFYAGVRPVLACIAGLWVGYRYVAAGRPHYAGTMLVLFCLSAAGLSFVSQVLSLDQSASAKSGFPVAACVAALAICIAEKRNWSALVALAILAPAAVLTFYRQSIVLLGLGALALLLSYSPLTLVGRTAGPQLTIRRSSAIMLFVFLLSILLAYLLFGDLVWTFLQSTESRYIQSIKKWNEFLYALNQGTALGTETIRADGLSYILNNIDAYFLPNGMINDANFELRSIWGGPSYYTSGVSPVRDSVLVFLLVVFGFGLTSTLLSIMSAVALRNLFVRRPSGVFISTCLCLSALAVLFFLDGLSLTQFEKALFFGLIVSFAFPLPLKRSSVSRGLNGSR